MSEVMKKAVEDLHTRRAKAKEMGGADKVEDQHKAGKLSVRERIDLLFDVNTFVEIGIHATTNSTLSEMKDKYTPADGVVTGYGKVNGRLIAVSAYDFTVMGGSIGYVNEKKVSRIREIALSQKIPIVWLLDSAGGRVQELAGSQFAESGQLFMEQSIMSGVVPQVAAVMGQCAAGTAYIPALADFVPMVKGTSSMALAGPPLVKAVIGEDISMEDLGGSKIHCNISGVGDLEVENDEACIQVIKDYLSYFPENCQQDTPLQEPKANPFDVNELLNIVPDDSKRPYDMHLIIKHIVDEGKVLEIKPNFAKNIIVGLARIGGYPIGIIANQPKVMAGVLTSDASDKASRFINLCDAFNIPLLFLQDVPGFMVGSKVEKEGIIRHGAKMLYSVSNATVPKLTVTIRKAYGAGYYVMCGKGYQPDLIVGWPSAEISLMGAEGAVNIGFRKQIESSENPDETRKQLVENFRSRINAYMPASNALIDDIIDPRETRDVLIKSLELTRGKKIERPYRKHGIMPV
jgi:acetyl-CoA carboxylase carboxyltransferase component